MATMEGSLSKWTNVMKGWQYRWFVLDDNAGLLSYYTVSNVFVLGLGYKQIVYCSRWRPCAVPFVIAKYLHSIFCNIW